MQSAGFRADEVAHVSYMPRCFADYFTAAQPIDPLENDSLVRLAKEGKHEYDLVRASSRIETGKTIMKEFLNTYTGTVCEM